MSYALRKCKVCGKIYEGCHTPNPTGMFRWRDVACSKECGAIYFKQVMDARNECVDTSPNIVEYTEDKQDLCSAEEIEEQPVDSCCGDFNDDDDDAPDDIVADEMKEV